MPRLRGQQRATGLRARSRMEGTGSHGPGPACTLDRPSRPHRHPCFRGRSHLRPGPPAAGKGPHGLQASRKRKLFAQGVGAGEDFHTLRSPSPVALQRTSLSKRPLAPFIRPQYTRTLPPSSRPPPLPPAHRPAGFASVARSPKTATASSFATHLPITHGPAAVRVSRGLWIR